ncbi:MAG: hypothetical protein II304_02020 [Bacteroidales bacterium]|jgi:ParB-like chromosome segregation protein Spo0J|nr:hypothetical protein [Bacteroidales bacterium]
MRYSNQVAVAKAQCCDLIVKLKSNNTLPIEKAEGYEFLINKYGLLPEEVAYIIGKTRPTIVNTLRLLKLPEKVIEYMKQGKLSLGHALSLLTLKDKTEIKEAADKIVANGLTVRQIEKPKKKINKAEYKNYTDSENSLLDWAVEETIRKYLEQGGKEEEIESLEYVDYFFCMLLYDKGKTAVRNFVRNYTYNPKQKKQPVFKAA